MLSLSDNNQVYFTEVFNSISIYLVDFFKSDNPYFEQVVDHI